MIHIRGWLVSPHANLDNYLYISRDGVPGSITIKADDEGFVVDIYDDNVNQQLQATTFAMYAALMQEQQTDDLFDECK